ncbi:ElaA protein [Azospirillum lipoferum]|uniref:GNAT family N-acetyltransferase n=1 Tax=Azospirillum lipoferum TaxID=193 RepID=A0A5A9GTN2_AZOLI|nr:MULTISPECIES: GNAT family N-acetyltransferase [Azospirillum]KAA0597185.1 GNAT family N-acetyltransferase [Azospirillum lipoferum]MCP1608688.1 ElaA protein [Azospirillum lipoferum]MDW5535994.1 GNAT family N-acetyltransferase [Azospirillum sp. NL1]
MTNFPPAIRPVEFHTLTLTELHDLLALRSRVFVVEQRCPYPDIDGRDPGALHLIATDADGAIVGCARCLDPEGDGPDSPVSFGRLAVDPSQRSTGLGRALVAESLAVLADRWPGRDVVIGAQLYLERFYGSFGLVRDTEPYDDFGIPHIDMRLRR